MKVTTAVKMMAWLAFLAGISVAQVKYVAVVETEVDAQSGVAADLNPAEVRQITAVPPGKYNIMTSETVQAQGGAVLEECAEENCVIALGSRIGADYIVRGIVSKLQTRFTLSVEMYETENGNLVASSAPVRSENIGELVEKAATACANMYKKFADTRSSAQKPQATYTVAVNVNPANGGIVSRNPNQMYYTPGTNVSITATPASGYTFTSWSGASTSTNATLIGPIDRDLTLTANFQYLEQTYTLTTNVSPQGGGSVTRNPDKEEYTAGERVTVNLYQ